jgi:hypothetical protein
MDGHPRLDGRLLSKKELILQLYDDATADKGRAEGRRGDRKGNGEERKRKREDGGRLPCACACDISSCVLSCTCNHANGKTRPADPTLAVATSIITVHRHHHHHQHHHSSFIIHLHHQYSTGRVRLKSGKYGSSSSRVVRARGRAGTREGSGIANAAPREVKMGGGRNGMEWEDRASDIVFTYLPTSLATKEKERERKIERKTK